ncbi:MAG: hypothetical protein ACRD8U_24325 [Pyrinomonadaceae bacterium]
MMHFTKIVRYAVVGMLVSFSVSGMFGNAYAQQDADSKAQKRVGDVGRDPFRKYEAPRVVKKIAGQVSPPSLQERIAQYKAQKQAAMSARMAAPKPTTALLLSEMQVVGISRSPRGYAAIVEATPIKLSYVIYPGEKFYDGQLVAIEDNRLIFRREIVFLDGRRERSVEVKPMRQANAVSSMAAVQASPSNAMVADPGKPPEQSAAGPTKP